MKYLILLIALAACAPKPNQEQAVKTTLANTWENVTGGEEITINLISVAGGSLTASFGTGGTCQYDIGVTWTDPEQRDPNIGTMQIADGTIIVNAPNLNCQFLEGSWTYAVLVSNKLQLCRSTGGCQEFE